ncbi:cryptochrome/photolyase family protein [Alicyclobacillus ferrooxydans]|uniref:Deoxyribodipyrimidine photo-lyase n=1 Tax=Alicyclobacillus ferrooxydans TaxID=471514 RepID=A0A0P9D0A2_9BACL|nr:deoxyribodipyrimidine photo-lyase [Alicyclobacillus ferrooxydans]KPV42891.1 hypothetical protein AN477_15265 [Alicyclobacillus ferrooxydans]
MARATIVWFRNDLRITDNPALWRAAQRGPVIPVFIHSPDGAPYGYAGEAAAWFIHESVTALACSLRKLGTPLVIRRGPVLSVLQDLVQETSADALYFNARYEAPSRAIDADIVQHFRASGLAVERTHAGMLMKPGAVLSEKQQPYKVFTAFWRQVMRQNVMKPLPAPAHLVPVSDQVQSLSLGETGLLHSVPWYEKLSEHWQPGEQGAMTQWSHFIDHVLYGYASGRDFPAHDHASRFSPYFASGALSPRWVWHQLLTMREAREIPDTDIEGFLRQLAWREFAYDNLVHVPDMVHTPMRREFERFPWRSDHDALRTWQQGRTGYPLIDAGMRQLWETGWIHNRVRMVAASFLVKHLLISWTEGAAWFKDTLVDADVANNTMGWQWVTGCGFDASPFFRIFNPVTQGEKFDPEGNYVRRWVPELRQLHPRFIHRPWEAPRHVLRDAGIELGINYPLPMVDHAAARARALLAFQSIR